MKQLKIDKTFLIWIAKADIAKLKNGDKHEK